MVCSECDAYVVDVVEIDIGRVWHGTRECVRQVWRMFPCGGNDCFGSPAVMAEAPNRI